MISEAAATLVSGGTQGVGSLISGILNYYAVKDTNKKNYDLYLRQEKIGLAAQKFNEKMSKQQQALNERQQNFAEKESALARGERAEERGYGRMQSSYQRAAELLSQNMNLLQAKTAPLISRRA